MKNLTLVLSTVLVGMIARTIVCAGAGVPAPVWVTLGFAPAFAEVVLGYSYGSWVGRARTREFVDAVLTAPPPAHVVAPHERCPSCGEEAGRWSSPGTRCCPDMPWAWVCVRKPHEGGARG